MSNETSYTVISESDTRSIRFAWCKAGREGDRGFGLYIRVFDINEAYRWRNAKQDQYSDCQDRSFWVAETDIKLDGWRTFPG